MNNNNFDNNNRKDPRRQKFNFTKHKKYEVSEEQKFVSKSKKQLKKKIEEIKAEELWEDWDDNKDVDV